MELSEEIHRITLSANKAGMEYFHSFLQIYIAQDICVSPKIRNKSDSAYSSLSYSMYLIKLINLLLGSSKYIHRKFLFTWVWLKWVYTYLQMKIWSNWKIQSNLHKQNTILQIYILQIECVSWHSVQSQGISNNTLKY